MKILILLVYWLLVPSTSAGWVHIANIKYTSTDQNKTKLFIKEQQINTAIEDRSIRIKEIYTMINEHTH